METKITLNSEVRRKRAALALESSFPRVYRRALRRMLFSFAAVFLFASVGEAAEGGDSPTSALFLLALSLGALLGMLEAFFNSHYFRRGILPFEVLLLLYETAGADVSKHLLSGRRGADIFRRIGLSKSDRDEFLKKAKNSRTAIDLENVSPATVEEFARLMLAADQDLDKHLFSKGVNAEMFVRAFAWIIRLEEKAMYEDRWWGGDRIAAIQGIGREWSYGQKNMLSRYGRFADEDAAVAGVAERRKVYERDVRAVERVLLKHAGANVILIAKETRGAFEAFSALVSYARLGLSAPELEPFRFFIVDSQKLLESFGDRARLEIGLSHLLNEAARIGNVIVVFENLPGFAEHARALGTDITRLLDEYLRSDSVRVIALADSAGFQSVLEVRKSMMANFERVLVRGAGRQGIEMLIEDAIVPFERKYRLTFTVGAVSALIESGERYYAEKGLEDAVFDLLYELVPDLVHKGKRIVTAEDVHSLSEEKTGIPQTTAREDERARLLSLEAILRRRVVGQDEAITTISAALRRARAGIRDEKRPIGSFLFIGPTGVGKTETTKALAESFFGSEDAIVRLDMSEYATTDAVDKLIGSYLTATPGILSTRLKERPYCVLLLDEFEKTAREALDLFLQILDEGVFSDGRGERISARNAIIIATSNAGSDLMYEAMQRAGRMDLAKDEVVDTIISRGIFRPELVNRFDGIVLFSPLSRENLRDVVKLILGKLAKRLRAKGIELVLTDPLLDALVTAGMDPRFGARALNRIVKEKVENAIATAMLEGRARPGTRLEIRPDASQEDGFAIEVRG